MARKKFEFAIAPKARLVREESVKLDLPKEVGSGYAQTATLADLDAFLREARKLHGAFAETEPIVIETSGISTGTLATIPAGGE